jgi:hypothetical protein
MSFDSFTIAGIVVSLILVVGIVTVCAREGCTIDH